MLWTDVFDRDIPEIAGEDADDNIDRRGKPGLLKLTDGALERRLSADFRFHIAKLRADIDAFKKAMPPRPPSVYGIGEAEQPSDLKMFVRGNPYTFGVSAPRALPSLMNNGEAKLFTKGSGRWSWRRRSSSTRSPRASSSTACGAGTWAAASSTRRATSAWPAISRRIPSCSTTWRRSSSRTACPARSSTRTS